MIKIIQKVGFWLIILPILIACCLPQKMLEVIQNIYWGKGEIFLISMVLGVFFCIIGFMLEIEKDVKKIISH